MTETSQALRVGDATPIERLKVHAIVDGHAVCDSSLFALFTGNSGDVTCRRCLSKPATVDDPRCTSCGSDLDANDGAHYHGCGNAGQYADEPPTLDPPLEHATSVNPGDAAGTFVVDCGVCGAVGQPQQHRPDADAIAERHSEIGGFDR